MAVARYLGVFAALLALTLVTVLVTSLQLSPGSTIALGLSIAAAKAALVVLFFMHLNSERPMVYWPLALTAFLFVAMFAFILWSETDHIQVQSSRNDGVSIDAPWHASTQDDPPVDGFAASMIASTTR